MTITGNYGIIFIDSEILKSGLAILAERVYKDYSSDKFTEFYISLLNGNKLLVHKVSNLSEISQIEILRKISSMLESGDSIDFNEIAKNIEKY